MKLGLDSQLRLLWFVGIMIIAQRHYCHSPGSARAVKYNEQLHDVEVRCEPDPNLVKILDGNRSGYP